MTSAAPSSMLAEKYGRAIDIAAVIVVVAWHVAGAGSQLLADRADYHSFAVQAALWIAFGTAIGVGSVRLLNGQAGRFWAWSLAGTAVAISTLASLACPASELLTTDWAWGDAGWLIVLALLRLPIADICWFLALENAATFAILTSDGLHRSSLAGYITTLAGSASIQFAVVIAVRALNNAARYAASAAEADAAARERAVIAQRLHVARQARWEALAGTTEPLIRQLAIGLSDPGRTEVRGACAVEAARLRRLMAEGDDPADPLVHELHATADLASHRGVAVDIDSAGSLPVVPAEVRRCLTDIAIAVLNAAATHVRITIAGVGEGVAVCLVADSAAAIALPAISGRVTVEQQHDAHDLWLEARWNAP